MKSLERLVLKHLCAAVEASLDPLQFAYQPHIGVEDAIIFLLHKAYLHLEKAGSTVRVFDFSSALTPFDLPCSGISYWTLEVCICTCLTIRSDYLLKDSI